MPSWVKSEKLWNQAKDAAGKAGHAGNFRVITHIYKNLGGTVSSEGNGPTDYDDTALPSDLADKIDEAIGSSGLGALVRADIRHHESLREAVYNDEKREIEVVIITEGPGNQRDKNFYTTEAITQGVEVFEGVRSFLNHQTEGEEVERPEQDIHDLAAYFKDTKILTVTNEAGQSVSAIGATMCFADSEPGQLGYQTAKAAIMYAKQFPNSREVFAGLSINASGIRDGEIMIEGEEWTRITAFVDPKSVDIVTRPGRGGAFIELLESAVERGDLTKWRKTVMTIKEQVKKIQEMRVALAKLTGTDKAAKFILLAEAQATLGKAILKEMEPDDDKSKEMDDDAKKKEMDDEKKSKEMDPEMMEMMRSLVPRNADESEMDYDNRIAKVMDMIGGHEGKEMDDDEKKEMDDKKKMESASIDDLRKNFPAVYSKVREAVLKTEDVKDKDFGKVRDDLREARTALKISEDRQKASTKLEEAGIPAEYLAVNDLIGKSDAEMDREIERTTAMMEGAGLEMGAGSARTAEAGGGSKGAAPDVGHLRIPMKKPE